MVAFDATCRSQSINKLLKISQYANIDMMLLTNAVVSIMLVSLNRIHTRLHFRHIEQVSFTLYVQKVNYPDEPRKILNFKWFIIDSLRKCFKPPKAIYFSQTTTNNNSSLYFFALSFHFIDRYQIVQNVSPSLLIYILKKSHQQKSLCVSPDEFKLKSWYCRTLSFILR